MGSFFPSKFYNKKYYTGKFYPSPIISSEEESNSDGISSNFFNKKFFAKQYFPGRFFPAVTDITISETESGPASNFYPQKFFAKKYFPGRFWPTPPVFQELGGGGSTFNFDYLFPIDFSLFAQKLILLNANCPVSFGSNKNNIGYLSEDFSIDFELLYDLIATGISYHDRSFNDNFELLYKINKNLNVVFPINIELGINSTKYVLSNYTFPIQISLNEQQYKLLYKDFNFPIALGMEADRDLILVDIGHVGQRFWCNIKKINTFVLAR